MLRDLHSLSGFGRFKDGFNDLHHRDTVCTLDKGSPIFQDGVHPVLHLGVAGFRFSDVGLGIGHIRVSLPQKCLPFHKNILAPAVHPCGWRFFCFRAGKSPAEAGLECRGFIVSDRCELNRGIKTDNTLLRELKEQMKMLARTVKNTIPIFAEAVEFLR